MTMADPLDLYRMVSLIRQADQKIVEASPTDAMSNGEPLPGPVTFFAPATARMLPQPDVAVLAAQSLLKTG